MDNAFSLNYMWVEAVKLGQDQRGIWSMPQELQDNLITTAKSYPNIPINLWVDIYGVGHNSNGITTGVGRAIGQPNVAVRALDNVPEYALGDIFHRKKDDCEGEDEKDFLIWQQVDIARLLVLSHLLKEENQAAVYADLDLILFDPTESFDAMAQAVKILDDYGCVVGLINDGGCTPGVENQFMGFNQSQLELLNRHLIPATIYGIEEEADENGFELFWETFRKGKISEYGLDLVKIGIPIDSLEDRKDENNPLKVAGGHPAPNFDTGMK